MRFTNEVYEGLAAMPPNVMTWGGGGQLIADMVAQTRPRQIIEVGTWLGGSALNMATTAKALGLSPTPTIYCVDTWLGSVDYVDTTDPITDVRRHHGYPQIYYQFLSNVVHAGHTDIIVPVPLTSLAAARYFKLHNWTADLIYIDASHEYPEVLMDIDAYIQLCSPTGRIFGHDYQNPNVTAAVSQIAEHHGLTVRSFVTPQDGVFWTLDGTDTIARSPQPTSTFGP